MEPTVHSDQRTYRWLRSVEDAPRVVSGVWAGPPDLDLDDRRGLLQALRHAMAEQGFELQRARKMFFGRRVKAEREAAVALLQSEEATADAEQHWWLHHVIWRSGDGQSTVVCIADPDGQDLHFQGWGREADTCLEAVRDQLAANRP